MKKFLFVTVLSLAGFAHATVPTTITYQGALKQKGVPATGVHTATFEVMDISSKVYWADSLRPITVVNGLFSVQLTPTGVDWEHIIQPRLRISIDGEILSPAEPINATIYAVLSQSVVDGSVSPQKLDAAVQDHLIPNGAIMMFATECPAGWSRYSKLNGRFPIGVDPMDPSLAIPLSSGGSDKHSHAISTDGLHDHGGETSSANGGSPQHVGSPKGGTGGQYIEDINNQFDERVSQHNHQLSKDGAHNHGGSTSETKILPPFHTVYFCQKT